MRRVWLLGVLALGMGCGTGSPRREPRVPRPGLPTLTVMTYNVNFGLAGDPAALEAIAGTHADVVFLQETTPAWEAALRQRLSRRFPEQRYRHSAGAGGLAVLSRHPIRHDRYIPSPLGWFPAWRVVLETPVGPLQVLQLHLRPPVSDGGSWVSGYFTTRDFRARELRHFASYLAPELPTLAVGDFNEGHDGRAVRALRGTGLQSALAEFAPSATTWHWPTALGELRFTLDHILYSRDLDALDARVLSAGRSDHYPVVAVFQRAPSAQSPAPRPLGPLATAGISR
ncbi:MAG: endonuclease/exonuclease/phosphatase family protein [Deltaproteobacteria bacterium]|nr:endonuclease/exonuclease/phosphatase family protein [Deltaproteobacteria bacterium]